jgi:hypothetical protein
MRSNEGCWACDGRGAAAAAASPSPSATAQRIGAGGLLLVLLRSGSRAEEVRPLHPRLQGADSLQIYFIV